MASLKQTVCIHNEGLTETFVHSIHEPWDLRIKQLINVTLTSFQLTLSDTRTINYVCFVENLKGKN